MWVCLWLALGFDASIGNQVSLAWTRVSVHQDPDSNQPPLLHPLTPPPPTPIPPSHQGCFSVTLTSSPDNNHSSNDYATSLFSCSIAPFLPFFNLSLIPFGAGRPADSQSRCSVCASVRGGVLLKYNSLYLTVSGIELARTSMKLLTGFKSQSGARHIQGYEATHRCYLPPTDISEIMLGLFSNPTRPASGVGNQGRIIRSALIT